MTTEFKLPKGVRFSEELGLHLVFQEITIRGSKKKYCQVFVQEEGRYGFEVNQTYDFKSWKDMKKQYPTLKDFLYELSENQHWNANWNIHDVSRTFFIESLTGHEGLYDVTETIWFNNHEEMQEVQ